MTVSCSAGKGSTTSGVNPGQGGSSSAGAGIITGNNGGNGIITGNNGGSGGDTTVVSVDNPDTCEEAAANATYVGCDFWPTVVYNPVYSVFDFAAVVANAGATPAMVTVSRGGMMQTATVMPGSLAQIKLPWVPELKGADFDQATSGSRPTASVRVNGGAYHLVSTVPVTVWQFNPVEYRKDAAELAAENTKCTFPPSMSNGDGTNCESVSADAALLIPSTALTGNYRVSTKSAVPGTGAAPDASGGFAITATQNATHVKIQLADALAAGTGVMAAKKGDVVEYDLNAGDVLELLGQPGQGVPHAELSGSIVAANQRVQVIGFNPLTNVPSPVVVNSGACCADHLEETVLPAEVLGKHYLVAAPSTHKGTNSGHFVRFFGNFDGTTLGYKGTPPPGAPNTLSAGQVVEVDATGGFEVLASQPFAITSIMKSGTVQNGCTSGTTTADCFIGDPSMTDEVAVEQFRSQYIFLAPQDFEFNWADVMVPDGANVVLDGVALAGTKESVSPGWSVVRVPLMGGANMGAHKVTSDQAIGLQVMGFGHATSYYYPGGLNLKIISEPPVVR